jgi:pimeloyl-ACP methyl ester carboxylesterase
MRAPKSIPRRILTLRQHAARTAARTLFRVAMPHRRWKTPAGATELEARARDGLRLRGWTRAPATAKPIGTVLIVHGLTRNCTLDGIPWWSEQFVAGGWATAAIDLRGHGRSADDIVTFGANEALDVSGAFDACALLGFPRPWVVMGGSLGALAAQCAVLDDHRIDAVALLAMPASPWHGVRKGGRAIAELARSELRTHLGRPAAAAAAAVLTACGRAARGIARLVDAAHGGDILAAGDVRRRPLPPHMPAVLAVVGDRDVYDWRMTAAAWAPWRDATGARPFLSPAQAPEQRAWFVLAPGYGHPPASPHLLEWPGLRGVLFELLAALTPTAR